MQRRQNSKSTCCLVIGMHNSGTSLLGGLLYAAGIPMGERLLMRSGIPEQLRPRYDYFEDKDIVELQEKTLLDIQRHWSSYKGSYPLGSKSINQREEFRKNLAIIIKKRFKKTNLWAVKDPRIGIMLEDWLIVLNQLEINIKLIIMHRNPYSNIRSFSDKGQVPMLWAESLWQRTYINTYKIASKLNQDDIYLANFEEIINEPEEKTTEICSFLNVNASKNLSEKIKKHIDKSLPSQNLISKEYKIREETYRLSKILDSKKLNEDTPVESNLIFYEMKNSLNNNTLELNRQYLGDQTLKPKIKVAIVSAELQSFGICGGIGSAYYELAKTLAKSGHSVHVIIAKEFDENEVIKNKLENIEVIMCNSKNLSRLEFNRKIGEQLKSINAEVIHIHEWLGFSSGLREIIGNKTKLICVGLHGPTLWTRSGNPWPRNQDGELSVKEENLYEEGHIIALEKDAILNADLLISPSKYMADWVNKNLTNNKLDILTQRNCPLFERISCDNISKKISSRKLVFFGRLEERKGILLFINALAMLASKPDHVLFLGSDCQIKQDKLASEVISEKLKELKISYEFINNLSRKKALDFLKDGDDIIVIPSVIENSPCVVEELLDSKIKVITTDTGGTKEMVRESDLKWLSKPDSKDLAEKIDLALRTNQKEAFMLKAKIPSWEIELSWQAFHERIPRQSIINKPLQDSIYSKTQKIKNLIKQKIKKYLSKFKGKIIDEK